MEHRSLAVDAGVAGRPTPRIVGRRQVIAEALARVCDRVLGTDTPNDLAAGRFGAAGRWRHAARSCQGTIPIRQECNETVNRFDVSRPRGRQFILNGLCRLQSVKPLLWACGDCRSHFGIEPTNLSRNIGRLRFG
jgi:hypothetical protein